MCINTRNVFNQNNNQILYFQDTVFELYGTLKKQTFESNGKYKSSISLFIYIYFIVFTPIIVLYIYIDII